MNRRQAKIKALDMAHGLLHSASIAWPEDPTGDDDYTEEEHNMLSAELDALAQRMWERAENLRRVDSTTKIQKEK